MKNISNSTLLWATVIFIISSIFRLTSLDLIEFKYDEAFTVFELTQFYNNPYLMQVGPPQSTGVYNPPLFNYLMVIISFISRDPQFLSFLIALINTISIVFFYLVIKKFYGQFVGILSGLIYAFSPWSIIFSRKIWIPDLIFPFMVIFFYFFHQFILQKKESAILPLFIIFALLSQMHASGVFFLATTIIILIILKQKINFKSAFIGFLIGLIPAIPYFLRQLTSSPFCIDCHSFLQYQGIIKVYDLNVFLRPIQLLNGANFEVVLGKSYIEFLQMFPLIEYLNKIFYLQYLLLLAAAYLIFKIQRQYLFLLLFPTVLPFLYLLSKTPSYMHYFIIINPFIVLILAFSVKFIYGIVTHARGRLFESERRGLSPQTFGSETKFTQVRRSRRLACVVLAILMLTITIINVVFMHSFFQFLKIKQNIDGEYGTIYSLTKADMDKETSQYLLFPDYTQLRSYAFMFAQSPILHSKLGEYFIQKNQAQLAILEFKKALDLNQKDIFARANLTYLYIVTKKMNEAEKEIIILDEQNATVSAKLRKLIQK